VASPSTITRAAAFGSFRATRNQCWRHTTDIRPTDMRPSVLARAGQRQSAAHHAAMPTLFIAAGATQDGTLLLWD